MPPRYFESAADVDNNIVLGTTTESLYLEFKGTIHGFGAAEEEERKKGQQEACRDITQFANHLGGCLLIGVAERSKSEKDKTAGEFVPVTNPDGLKAWLDQAIANYCVPSTFAYQIDLIHHSSGTLVAVNVPPSVVPIFLWNKEGSKNREKVMGANTMQVMSRTNHGKKHLNPDEVERLRMNGSRAAKIAFDKAFTNIGQEVVLNPRALRFDSNSGKFIRFVARNSPITSVRIVEDESFTLQFATEKTDKDLVLTIPYGLVQECWKDTEKRLCLALSFDVGICADDSVMFLPR